MRPASSGRIRPDRPQHGGHQCLPQARAMPEHGPVGGRMSWLGTESHLAAGVRRLRFCLELGLDAGSAQVWGRTIPDRSLGAESLLRHQAGTGAHAGSRAVGGAVIVSAPNKQACKILKD